MRQSHGMTSFPRTNAPWKRFMRSGDGSRQVGRWGAVLIGARKGPLDWL
ncbi:hypothetical protein A7982_12027 [Minicystis rosea]|nr:hypothetical protein A7982_12027 [Minicystis rosea]